MTRFVVLTADDGNIEAYASLTRENKREYCERHGYKFAHYHLPDWYTLTPSLKELSPYWQLVFPIRAELASMNEGDWLFFSGADAAIIDPSITLDSIEGYWHFGQRHLLITKDENGLNNNGFFLRNCEWSRDYIERIWALRGQTFEIEGPDGRKHNFEEQGAFIKCLEGQEKHYLWMPQKITNGYEPCIYGDHYEDPVFMAHYPGKKTDERVYFIKRALGFVPRVALPQGYWIDDNDHVRDAQYLDHGLLSTFKR